MAVPKGKQKKSPKEYFDFLYTLTDEIDAFATRDFGFKTMPRDLKTFTFRAKMTKDDKEEFMALCDKYKIDVVAEYPLWKVELYRIKLDNIGEDLIRYVTLADSIFPQTMSEFDMRRNLQWKAIGTCYYYLQTFQTIMRRLPVDVEKYMTYVDDIRKEIGLLRKWKKSDNRFKEIIINKQIEQEVKRQIEIEAKVREEREKILAQ